MILMISSNHCRYKKKENNDGCEKIGINRRRVNQIWNKWQVVLKK